MVFDIANELTIGFIGFAVPALLLKQQRKMVVLLGTLALLCGLIIAAAALAITLLVPYLGSANAVMVVVVPMATVLRHKNNFGVSRGYSMLSPLFQRLEARLDKVEQES